MKGRSLLIQVEVMMTKCSHLRVSILKVPYDHHIPNVYLISVNLEDTNDLSVGLMNGDLLLPGNLLRREVFDPVIDNVSRHSANQCRYPT